MRAYTRRHRKEQEDYFRKGLEDSEVDTEGLSKQELDKMYQALDSLGAVPSSWDVPVSDSLREAWKDLGDREVAKYEYLRDEIKEALRESGFEEED